MEPRRMVDLIDRQQWLGPAAETVQAAIRHIYRVAGPMGQQIKNFLHGTWLGHPLHAVLTEVPIGAWTTALAFDALEAASGRTELGPGADTAVAIGVAGATGAALAGLTDWEHLAGRPARVGLVHATLNTTALLVYIASLVMRQQQQRSAGRTLAYLGYSIAGVSAYLGGDLVFAQKIGVDHATRGPEAGTIHPRPARTRIERGPIAPRGRGRRPNPAGAPGWPDLCPRRCLRATWAARWPKATWTATRSFVLATALATRSKTDM